MNKKVKSTLFILTGLLSIILSIIAFSMDVGIREDFASYYREDAYTGIQNAAAQTARNIVALCKIVRFGFGSILLIFGIFLIVKGIDNKDNPKIDVQQTSETKSNDNI